jgi:phosphatidylethanolamine/phosphatidyl-N-methylethanolamine N-methyltransferase
LDEKKVERAYAGWARIYDRIYGPVFQDSRERAIRSLRTQPGQRILEVGVGTGLVLPLYPRNCQIVGIDLSEAMLEKARARVQELGLGNVELYAMDAGRMRFPDSSFDVVVAAYVVTAVPEYQKVIREMIRVCKPEGRILMLNHLTSSNPVVAAIERAISPLCTHIGFRTDLSLKQVLEGHPLKVERHEKVRPLRMWHLLECRNEKLVPA